MTARYFTLIVLSFLLTACGGGGSPVETAPPGSLPTLEATVSAYGDSTQEAQGQPHAASRPGLLVANEGVGGTNTTALLNGTDGRHAPWPQEMARIKSLAVVINHGINDQGLTLDQYKANLRELVTVAQKAGKIVMLEVPNPAGEVQTPLMQQINFDVPAFEARRQGMRDVAVHMGVYLCEQPRVPLADGIHPTIEGYRMKADRLAFCIGELL
jgi:lysophospholipase L1-like esterase